MTKKKHDIVRLSKTVSHALRHKPWLYELELDDDGWVAVDDLLAGIREHQEVWHTLSEDDLAEMINQIDKRRYEMREGRIRALYGHSLPGKLAKNPARPPEFLYHGTIASALGAIRAEGLKPMRRQYVHLSTDKDTAAEVARRKRGETIILTIEAAEAARNGIPFYEGNEMVWLADLIPPEFIVIPDRPDSDV